VVINLWHGPAIDHAALPCCHGSVIQFETHLEGGRRVLSCHMYQRSADVFIGVPVNIASYALLTHMMAAVLDFDPGNLIISFGDVHIYNNHREQVREQLSREPRPFPSLKIDALVIPEEGEGVPLRKLLAIEYKDLHLEGYDPHPKISAPVAV